MGSVSNSEFKLALFLFGIVEILSFAFFITAGLYAGNIMEYLIDFSLLFILSFLSAIPVFGIVLTIVLAQYFGVIFDNLSPLGRVGYGLELVFPIIIYMITTVYTIFVVSKFIGGELESEI